MQTVHRPVCQRRCLTCPLAMGWRGAGQDRGGRSGGARPGLSRGADRPRSAGPAVTGDVECRAAVPGAFVDDAGATADGAGAHRTAPMRSSRYARTTTRMPATPGQRSTITIAPQCARVVRRASIRRHAPPARGWPGLPCSGTRRAARRPRSLAPRTDTLCDQEQLQLEVELLVDGAGAVVVVVRAAADAAVRGPPLTDPDLGLPVRCAVAVAPAVRLVLGTVAAAAARELRLPIRRLGVRIPPGAQPVQRHVGRAGPLHQARERRL